jgi:hypothetical protein
VCKRFTINSIVFHSSDYSEYEPSFGVAARHDRRPVTSSFLAAGHSSADESETMLLQRCSSPNTVMILRIATIDDDVARLQQRDQRVDELIYGTSG